MGLNFYKLADLENIKEFISSLTLSKILPAAVIAILGIAAIKIILKLYDKASARSRLDKSIFTFARAILKILMIFILVLMIVHSFGVDVSSLVALLSVLSLAVSLAVQGTLSNIAGGIMVLSAHPFKVGDFVEIGAVSGTVQETGLVYTKILSADNKEIFVPNSDVASAKIINYTALEKRRLDLYFSADYNCDPEKVKNALLKAAEGPLVLTDTPPFVAVNEYKESDIQYLLRIWTKTENYFDAKFAVTENVMKIFKEEKLEMAYPHMDIRIKEN